MCVIMRVSYPDTSRVFVFVCFVNFLIFFWFRICDSNLSINKKNKKKKKRLNWQPINDADKKDCYCRN